MNKEDFLQFQEEILKTTRDIKTSLMKNLDEKLNDLRQKYDYFERYLKHITESNSKLMGTVTTFQMNFDKFKELEFFKNKVDSMLITHEIRINNNNEEVSSMRAKYDRALMDNLLVPGYIGPSSTYKNIGDYIMHNIADIAKLKNDYDAMKNIFKDVKTKSDSSLKNMLNLTEALVKRCNDYTNAQIKDVKNLIYDKYQALEEKEGEMKDIVKKYQEEEKNKLSTLDVFKLDIMSILETRTSESKKSQDELLFSEINKNNTFIENYTRNIIEDKLKNVENNIKDIEKEISKLKLFNRKNNTSPSINKNATEEKLHKNKSNQNLLKGKMNYFNDIPNKTLKNVKAMSAINKKMIKKISDNCDKSLENILFEEIEKDNKRKKEEKEIPDIVLKHKEAKFLLLKNNQSQSQSQKFGKNNINEIKTERAKNIMGLKILNKKRENSQRNSESFSLIQKNDNLDEENTKKNIYDINNKSENYNSNIKIKMNENNKDNDTIEPNDKNTQNKKMYHLITDENEENIQNNFQNKTKDTVNDNNNTNIKKNYEEKEVRNIIDELKIPRILEKRILSKDELEEIKLNTEKIRNSNNKANFKVTQHKSSSASYKTIQKNNKIYLSPKINPAKNENNTIKKWKKNMLNKKTNIKNERYYMVNLDLKQNNYTTNGATILANKKLLNNHITKVENSNSFSMLFNVNLAKKIFQNNGN